MNNRSFLIKLLSLLVLLLILFLVEMNAQTENRLMAKKTLPKSRLELSRRSQNGSFYDVIGRKSAAFGYEHRNMEAWVYPIKILDDFALEFQIEGYNLPFQGRDILTNIEVRPEATIFTYSHAAFTVRQIIYAPVDEQGLISLLDINTRLPMNIGVSFRPKLRLMWAGNMMTPFVGQDETEKYYYIGEETHRYYAIVGSPGARDVSLMPYQEEPRDIPVKYTLKISPDEAAENFVPIVMAASTDGRAKAVANYRNLLTNAVALYEKNVAYYEDFLNRTTDIKTPDERLNTALAWAKIGTEKGVATNPYLGTGLVAGFRTSGESERPGFAWYFGRDALWTALAINSYGDFATTRTALEFLKKFQRADGKIPHEISQSATLIDWWNGYPYAWAATDATPLYVIVHADLFDMSGDLEFLKANWDSIRKAYQFQETTDTDNNGLIENTKFGHGWVEGGALYPPHEEIYLQGVWIAGSEKMAKMAEILGDKALAQKALDNAGKTRAAMEATFWLEDREFYAYATQIPRKSPVTAEPGPNRERRQKRLSELQNSKIYDEDTVLPAVPLWFRTMRDEDRVQRQIDRLGSAKIATDWGARILANDSQLYDPLSYHYGSVWGLFTGWQSLAAYNYGRQHVGFQALTANSLLKFTNALGYITELLSGDFNAPFGRSSHHQIWSEAMIFSPAARGMLGIEISDAGKTVRFAPQIPANWDYLEAKNVRAGAALYDFSLKRSTGKTTITVSKRETKTTGGQKLVLAPAFPLDATITKVSANGKNLIFATKSFGDLQQIETTIEINGAAVEISFEYSPGTDVYLIPPSLAAGQESVGLRIVRASAQPNGLFLLLEGRAGRTYELPIKSPRNFREIEGVGISAAPNGKRLLRVTFTGETKEYVRREFLLPFANATP